MAASFRCLSSLLTTSTRPIVHARGLSTAANAFAKLRSSLRTRTSPAAAGEYDAIIVGGGHNGLVCAYYCTVLCPSLFFFFTLRSNNCTLFTSATLVWALTDSGEGRIEGSSTREPWYRWWRCCY